MYSAYPEIFVPSHELSLLGDLRDYQPWVFEHCLRVGGIATATSLTFLPQWWREVVKYLFFHDVGKLLIPIEISNKPAPLTKEELKLISLHQPFGLEIISRRFNLGKTLWIDVSSILGNLHGNAPKVGYPPADMASLLIARIADHLDSSVYPKPYNNSTIPLHRTYQLYNHLTKRGDDSRIVLAAIGYLQTALGGANLY